MTGRLEYTNISVPSVTAESSASVTQQATACALRTTLLANPTLILNPVVPAQAPRSLPLRWAHGMLHREAPSLDHSRLRWYREATRTYRLTAEYFVPAGLRVLAQLTVNGLENIPLKGPVILAANHRDNLDGPLLLHVVPRTVHVAARADGFGTGGLCTLWRHLCAFPADAWGMRHALSMLSGDGVVAVFTQGMISKQLNTTSGAVGLLALYSGAPVVPVAISGTDTVHLGCLFAKRANIQVRFGAPQTFTRGGRGAPRSLVVANEILRQIGVLLPEQPRADPLS